MKTQRNTRKERDHLSSRLLMGLVALFVCGSFTLDAQAQTLFSRSGDESAEQGVVVPVATVITLEDLTGTDLSGMSSAWWKALRKGHTRLLGSSDEQVKERAMQNIIYFAKTYRDHVDFTRATPKLYKIYRSDENEAYRIMALSALHAIGNRNAMRLLREDVSLEQSERVRKQILYVLADY